MAEPAERLAEIEKDGIRVVARRRAWEIYKATESLNDGYILRMGAFFAGWVAAEDEYRTEHTRLSEELARAREQFEEAAGLSHQFRNERDAMREVVEAARALRDCYHGMHGMECQHSVAVTGALARLDGASKVLHP